VPNKLGYVISAVSTTRACGDTGVILSTSVAVAIQQGKYSNADRKTALQIAPIEKNTRF